MRSLDLWQRFEYTAMDPGLERIKAFLNASGSPQKRFKAVHVAGTNGKGSTAMMISKVLESAGYRTGLYVSPHLVRLSERIRVNSKEISEGCLNKLARKYHRLAETHKLTFFEFITALAYIYFAEKKIDIAVLETGLGGRFDATNVIERPLASVITDIDYDHTAILGKSIGLIAKEKAGIIKHGCPVVSGAQNIRARRVIRDSARAGRCLLWEAGRDFRYKYLRTDWQDSRQFLEFIRRGKKLKLVLPLLGEYQLKNCSLAVACAKLLNEKGCRVPEKAIIDGISEAVWPGRFDVRKIRLSGGLKTLILDGAHNPQAMSVFVSSFKNSVWYGAPLDVIFGVLKDKDYRAIAKKVSGLGGKLTLVPVNSKRALGPAALLRAFGNIRGANSIVTASSLRMGLKKARAGVVVITGSLYLVGEALKLYGDKIISKRD